MELVRAKPTIDSENFPSGNMNLQVLKWVGMLSPVFFFAIYVSASALSGVNGMHIWKQSDVYATILGFAGFKGYEPFALFDDVATVFNMPFYTGIIAFIGESTRYDYLFVATFLNLGMAMIIFASVYRYFLKQNLVVSAIVFGLLFSGSPLMLHYFGVPMPDVFGMALGLVAFVILKSEGLTVRGLTLASLPLALATGTKPVITFSFLIWYGVELLLTHRKRLIPMLTLRFGRGEAQKLGLMALLLVYLGFLAFFTERLRSLLLGQEPSALLQDPSRYFGNLAIRLDPSTWAIAADRLNYFGPWGVAFLLLLASLLTLIIVKSQPASFSIIGAWVSYFVGWAVFPLLYKIHDHYQLQHALILVFAVSHGLGTLAVIYRPQLLRLTALGQFGALVILTSVSGFQVFFHGNGLSHIERVSFWNGVEFALRDTPVFLFVDNDPMSNSPVVGGLTSTKFHKLSGEDASARCAEIFEKEDAILFEKPSACGVPPEITPKALLEDGSYLFVMPGQQ